jgi:hypothetical protein
MFARPTHPTSRTQAPSCQFTSVFLSSPLNHCICIPWSSGVSSLRGVAFVRRAVEPPPRASSRSGAASPASPPPAGAPSTDVAAPSPASLGGCQHRSATPAALPTTYHPPLLPLTVPMNTWIDSGPFVSTHVGEGRGCTPCAVVAMSPEQLAFVLVAPLFPSPLNQALMRLLHPSQSQHLLALHPPR